MSNHPDGAHPESTPATQSSVPEAPETPETAAPTPAARKTDETPTTPEPLAPSNAKPEDEPTMNPHAAKAVRLFQFLAQARRLRENTTVDVRSYDNRGSVTWLSEVAKDVVSRGWPVQMHPRLMDRLGMPSADEPEQNGDELENEDVILVASRPAQLQAPAPDAQVAPWLDGAPNNYKRRPKVHKTSADGKGEFSDQPQELREKVDAWFAQWEQWSHVAAYQDFYKNLFDAHINASQSSEDFEMVLGLGLLTWNAEDAPLIRRHLFTASVATELDKATGRICVRLADAASSLKAELDFVPAQTLQDRTFVADVTAKVAEFTGHVLDTDLFDELGTITAHSLSTSAVYLPRGTAADPSRNLVVTWAPALILRERRNAGFAQAFDDIAQQIQESGEVPAGLLSLIDPDKTPEPLSTTAPGAVVAFGDEVFSPLPLNEVQRRIIERVDKHSQTVVQGPPGTGKTHTAAALLSHFLAQGKRVLVTAHTERALYEVRDKLPEEIRELAVSVIGTSVSDMADLRVAVDKISRASAEFDANDAKRAIALAEDNLRILRERRQSLLGQIAAEFRRKAEPLEVEGYAESPARAMEKLQDDAAKYQWIDEFLAAASAEDFPLGREEIETYCALFPRLKSVDPYQVEASHSLDTSNLPSFSDFDEVDQAVAELRQEYATIRGAINEQQWQALNAVNASDRKSAFKQVMAIRKLLDDVRSHARPWAPALLEAYDNAELEGWRAKAVEAQHSVEKMNTSLQEHSEFQKISIKGEPESYLAYAKNLAQFLGEKGPLKTDVHGVVKIGMFAPKILKEGREFFANVKVDGEQPSTAKQVQAVVAKIQLGWAVESLRDELPEWLRREDKDPVTLVAGISADAAQAIAAAQALSEFDSASQLAARFNLPPNSASIPELVTLLENFSRLLEIDRQVAFKEERIKKLNKRIGDLLTDNRRVRWLSKYNDAARNRDSAAMEAAFAEGEAMREQYATLKTFDRLERQLRAWSARLMEALRSQEKPQAMLDRLRDIHSAINWHKASAQLNAEDRNDLAQMQGEVAMLEKQIHKQVRALAAERAWFEALNSNRISNTTRKNLVEYAQSVKRLGKGTGKHASRRRREIRKSLDSCRAAVPVWIMPLHRLIDQLDLQGDMFDVVMVDEASQAGSEAAFLQYLAPTIVVIGDDKQVSPSAIGVNEDEVRKLADQFLDDDDDKPGWSDPKRSLFDIALARFGGRLTLTEHRRCVSEIIGFSNQIAYEPDRIKLEAVREVRADRLAPFKIVHTPYAFQENNASKVNRGEADALVEKLVECLEDPAYEHKTIGVISLLSSSKQADYIQNRLLDIVPPDVWEKHQLCVGSPAEFQGAERDVIFLSMVSAKDDNKRLTALAKEDYVQRYNVAVSRAKDQVWLFHSISIDQLPNPEDLRYKLLQYAYGIANRRPDSGPAARVSDTEHTEPFDSLFEQRVYNQLVDRGYHVIPQFPAQQYRIDLVVQGADARLAIECDGDNWHGPEHAEKDLARQRELERLGWTFIRIFESDFYLDQDAEMRRVLNRLDDMGITPHQGDDAGAGAEADSKAGENIIVLEKSERAEETKAATDAPV